MKTEHPNPPSIALRSASTDMPGALRKGQRTKAATSTTRPAIIAAMMHCNGLGCIKSERHLPVCIYVCAYPFTIVEPGQ
jgi:hypothetical protein